MADEDFGTDMEDGGGAPKKGGIPTIIIIIAIALVMGAGGFFAGKIFTGGEEEKAPVAKQDNKKEEKKADKEKKSTKKKESEPEEEDDGLGEDDTVEGEEQVNMEGSSKSGIMVLEPFTVNLNDPFGRRYAEVVVNFEISQKRMVSKILENELIKPKMRDEIFMIISSKSYNELKSTSGKVTLKEEIQMRVNEILKEEFGVEPVSGVYFTKFIIQ